MQLPKYIGAKEPFSECLAEDRRAKELVSSHKLVGIAMSTTTMRWQERMDDFASRLQEAQPGTIFSIHGSVGRGKTRFLRDTAIRLAEQNRIPMLLSPPQGEEDTAGVALASAADTLKAHTLLNGEVATLTDLQASRDEKIAIVLAGVRAAKNSVVILMDEPARWVAGEWSGETSTASRNFTRRVCHELVINSGCKVIYTGNNFGVQIEEVAYNLPKAWNEIDLPEKLTEHSGWKEVREGLNGSFIAQSTPLHYRMLTILSVLSTPAEAVEAARTCLNVKQLATLLEQCSKNQPLFRQAWARFALVRKAFTQDLYEQLADELTSDLRFVVEELLLTKIDGSYELHPLLVQVIDAKDVLGTYYRGVQQVLVTYYLGKQASLADATEAFFHATEAGDDALASQTQPFFVEQLHLRGRSLSKQKKHYEAATAFRQAVELDPTDDYAHHYCAFNLDWMAGDQPTIESEYQNAIECNPQHPWWHSRWINYLITVGRTMDARAAFANATEALQDAIDSHPDYVYRSLHSWIAALLLHRGQLDFARQVLDLVPAEVRRDHRGIIALEEKLAAMAEARRGRGVFPLSVPASQHWRKAPHLDFPPQVGGKELRTWHPARLEAVTPWIITLIVGKPPEAGSPPIFGVVTLPVERFDAAALDESAADLRPGRFLELAFYGEEGILRIRTHPESDWKDPDLPYLNPSDTLRYLRKQERSS